MGIFYKVTAPNGKQSHLFGTIHLNDEDVVSLPIEIKKAFMHAKTCIFEAPVRDDEEALELFASSILSYSMKNDTNEYTNPIALMMAESYLSTSNAFANLDQHKIKSLAKRLSPILLSQTLLLPLQVSDLSRLINGLDKQMINEATSNNKELKYLETAEEQLKAIIGYQFTWDEQIDYFNFVLNHIYDEKEIKTVDETKKEYLSDNEDIGIKSISLCTHEYPSSGIVKRYEYSLISDRDRIMVQGMKTYLDQGHAFVAVGAGHLKGIINELCIDNYQVERVELGARVHPISCSKKAVPGFYFFNQPKHKEVDMINTDCSIRFQ